MNPYALIPLVTVFVSFALGLISYNSRSEHSSNRIFIFLYLSFVIFAFSEFGYLQAESYERARFWMVLSSVWAFILALSLHFALLYTGKLKNIKRVLLLYSYIPAFIFTILNVTTDLISTGPVMKSYGWTYVLSNDSLLLVFVVLWAVSIAVADTILVFLYYHELNERNMKKQALLIFIGYMAPGIVVFFINLIVIVVGIDLPKLYSLGLLGSSLFLGYAIYNRRLFSMEISATMKSILEGISEILILTDNDGIITKVNNSTERLLGYPENILKGRTLRILFPDKEWQRLCNSDNNEFISDISNTEFTLIGREGKRLPVLLYSSKIIGPKEKIGGYILIGKDLTDQKKTEIQISDLEDKFRILFEYAHDSIYINDINGKIMDINRAAMTISGRKKKEFIGQNIFNTNLISADQMMSVFKLLIKYKKGKLIAPFEVALNRKDGSKKYLEISTFPLNEGERQIIIIIARDITIHKQIEELLINEDYYRTVIDNLDEGIANIDSDKIFTFVNSAAEKIFGVPSGGLIGQKLEKFIASNNLHIIRGQIENRKHGLSGKYEIEIIHPVKGSRCILVNGNSRFNEDGSFLGSYGVLRDISEQRETENKISIALKEKDILFKEIHHRVKNNLQVISSLLNMQSRCIKDKEASQQIKESRDRVFSMSLIHEVLYQSGKNTFIDIKEYLIKLAINLYHSYSINEKEIDLQIDIYKVFLNNSQTIPCGLILNELISNSLKHAFNTHEEGVIRINLSMDSTNRITFMYSDNGTPFPNDFDVKSIKTLGLRLVNTLVRQLDATMILDTNNKSFKIKFLKQIITHEIE